VNAVLKVGEKCNLLLPPLAAQIIRNWNQSHNMVLKKRGCEEKQYRAQYGINVFQTMRKYPFPPGGGLTEHGVGGSGLAKLHGFTSCNRVGPLAKGCGEVVGRPKPRAPLSGAP